MTKGLLRRDLVTAGWAVTMEKKALIVALP